jgi:hypothetical protein
LNEENSGSRHLPANQNHTSLIFSGAALLLIISIMLFLASVANATQWLVLQGFRYYGICTLLLSLAFFIFSVVELVSRVRNKCHKNKAK